MAASKRAGIVPFIRARCPRCGKGDVFLNKVMSFKKFSDTHEECPKCGLKYEPETGFFVGAMYWTYALLVGLTVVMSVALYQVDLFDEAVYIIPALIIFLLPWVFRTGRLLMLYVVYPVMYKKLFFGSTEEDDFS
jgi:uncharacterized protein (DUF983 family)